MGFKGHVVETGAYWGVRSKSSRNQSSNDKCSGGGETHLAKSGKTKRVGGGTTKTVNKGNDADSKKITPRTPDISLNLEIPPTAPDIRCTLSCFENSSASGANTSGRQIPFKSMIQAYHLSKQ